MAAARGVPQGLLPRARRAFYRQRVTRELLRWVLRSRLGKPRYDLSHIPFHSEFDTRGSVQRDEALLLYALTRVLRPRVVLEIGFLGGQNSFNLLQALEPPGVLHSVDIAPASAEIAHTAFGDFANFTFHHMSQSELPADLLGGARADLVFLDASHDLDLNIQTFRRLLSLMADDAILAIHDTGTWPGARFTPLMDAYAAHYPDWWLDGRHEFQHQRDDRVFVNWILENHADFAQLHLHTLNTPRHGMTLVQRTRPLPV